MIKWPVKKDFENEFDWLYAVIETGFDMMHAHFDRIDVIFDRTLQRSEEDTNAIQINVIEIESA